MNKIRVPTVFHYLLIRLICLDMDQYQYCDYYLTGCAVCHTLKAKRCGGCKIERYCSEECQRAHWKHHKLICGKPHEEAKILYNLYHIDRITISNLYFEFAPVTMAIGLHIIIGDIYDFTEHLTPSACTSSELDHASVEKFLAENQEAQGWKNNDKFIVMVLEHKNQRIVRLI